MSNLVHESATMTFDSAPLAAAPGSQQHSSERPQHLQQKPSGVDASTPTSSAGLRIDTVQQHGNTQSNMANSMDVKDRGQNNGFISTESSLPTGESTPEVVARSAVNSSNHKQDGTQEELDNNTSLPKYFSLPPSRRPSNGSATPHRPLPSHQKRSSGLATPRPSVQFTRENSDNEGQAFSHSRASSFGGDEADPSRKGQPSLLSKLKAFAASPSFPTHSRSGSAVTGDDAPEPRRGADQSNSTEERAPFRFPLTLEEPGSEGDADAESSSGEHAGIPKKKKRKFRRKPDTAPTTPSSAVHPHFPVTDPLTPPTDNYQQPGYFSRRTGPNTIPPHIRDGVSEDEGRDRLTRDTMWRRRSGWLQTARGFTHSDRRDGLNTSEDKRPSNLRRITGFGGPSEMNEGIGAAWRRHRGERGSSLSAQRWRQIKAGLKMIGQRRKHESTVDHVKSAELLAELASGIPAALLLASMFQRDEHGSKRIPILLEQLKVHVTDSQFVSHSGDRHLVFRIELEYGNGMTRMKWVIHRTLKDFANLHLKYKLQIGTQKYIQLRSSDSGNSLPHFPRSAFPYLRGVRGLESDGEDDDDDGGYDTAADATSGNERGNKKKKRSSMGLPRRRSSMTPQEGSAASGQAEGRSASIAAGVRKESYPERQRKKLESYLQKMIRFLIFRPDSNRLCKFLELSALGVRLAAEGSYHGKEGFLVIQSSKGLDFRRALNPSMIKSRHSPKWFLVRHSYVVCVDSPEDMHIYDVFLVDSHFEIQTQGGRLRDRKAKELAKSAKDSAAHPQHHTLRLQNSERKLRLLARNERQLHQFEDSIQFMVQSTPWAKPNRFGSFAPVRRNCFAQWLVDGRDYMWVVSRAINQAKDVIYIHDWWLSPELYMRRPAAISQKWRLDRLLQRKAQEGVKVFVIMYRNINSAIPIDSEYSKFSLLDLHPNVFVQRSPNQFRQNTFFWAHHEKLCLIDHTIAFIGGIDLCFGRWDTPQHLCTDDKLTGFELTDMPKDSDHCQLWPGKDYSNPRVQDFYELAKPYEEMYDREVVPRMPWHDIAMHVVGQPARDLVRHFVQRWNYILRQRKPTRPTPFLLPPPDFDPADLEALGLDGTCEVQILRSSTTWSTGTPDITEHSIMNTYVKLIEKSEHFVYIENQFFVSSCEIEGKRMENKIGDALVERIIRASKNNEDWRAVIIIPLMPGFQNTVDTEGGTSVRLIMQCQYRSICRGETSIFARLRSYGIEPEDYIQFFSLRAWGKIGPRKQLVTEQLYIHAKCMVVDDRAAIIGSANINERSMLGSRDSECAAVVRDTDMIWSTMSGKPYLVGRFPHTLRMRLMREHIGIDVDEVLEQELAADLAKQDTKIDETPESPSEQQDDLDANQKPVNADKQDERELIERRHKLQDEFLARSEEMHSFNHDVDWNQANNPNLKSNKKLTVDSRVQRNQQHKQDLEGLGTDQMKRLGHTTRGDGRDSYLDSDNMELLVSNAVPDGKGDKNTPEIREEHGREQENGADSKEDSDAFQAKENHMEPNAESSKPTTPLKHGDALEKDEHGAHSHLHSNGYGPSDNVYHGHPLASDLKQPAIDKNCMKDPVSEQFYLDIWQTIADNNTKLFRSVFRCMPDSEVKTWTHYKEYTAYAERFVDMQNSSYHATTRNQLRPSSQPTSGPPGSGTRNVMKGEKEHHKSGETKEKGSQAAANQQSADDSLRKWASEANKAQIEREKTEQLNQEEPEGLTAQGEKAGLDMVNSKSSDSSNEHNNNHNHNGEISRNNVDGAAPTAEHDGTLNRQRSAAHSVGYSEGSNAPQLGNFQSQRRRRRAATRSSKREFHAADDIISSEEAEELLNMVQGHLVQWPYEWWVFLLCIWIWKRKKMEG